MKHLALMAAIILAANILFAQKDYFDKAVLKEIKGGTGFYYETILKDINAVENKKIEKKQEKRFQVDFSGKTLPNKFDLYKSYWHNKPVSQGNTSTCWAFSAISFFESEVYRQTKQEVKLSEMFIVYYEFIEKAKRFVLERGNSEFPQGSECNAVTRIMKKYGIVPLAAYSGKKLEEIYYSHDKMYNEMTSYLASVKRDNNWSETTVIGTITAIMNNYMGQPPSEINISGKNITSRQYLTDVLKLNPDDYVDILSIMQQPFWKKVEYEVPDNWWHSADYFNLPLTEFMSVIKSSIRKGYTMAIGGDVSEPGMDRETQLGVIPDFDIPSQYINDAARQMRFSNKTTTDDHGLHIVGYYEKDGKDWYLVKDSGSGSRNNDKNAKEFGFYFYSEDYIKLKIMDFMVHKDMLADLFKKFVK